MNDDTKNTESNNVEMENAVSQWLGIVAHMDPQLRYTPIMISNSRRTRKKPKFLQPLSGKPSAQRNEKCQCGSGLKYKKCCGK